MPRRATHVHRKAVESYVGKDVDPTTQANLLMERWTGVSEWIAKTHPHARRVVWSCQERKWIYVLFAEIEL